MAYVISGDCVGCGSCAEVCPADAISGEHQRLETHGEGNRRD